MSDIDPATENGQLFLGLLAIRGNALAHETTTWVSPNFRRFYTVSIEGYTRSVPVEEIYVPTK